MEIFCGSNCRMLGNIIDHIIKYRLCRVDTVQIESDIRHGIRLHLNIGLNTTTISHLTTFLGIEHLRKGVWNMLFITTTSMFVINGLYTATTGNVVFGGRQFQITIIRNLDVGNLHQSFTIRACTYYYSSIQILYRAADYLTCRSRLVIDKNHNRHHCINRLQTGLIFRVGTTDFSFRLHQGHPLRYPHIGDIHTLCQGTSSIATQVQNQFRGTLLLQVQKSTTHRFCRLTRESIQVDIPYAIRTHSIIGNLWHLDTTTGNLKGHLLTR